MTRQELRVWLQEWQCGCGMPEAAARFLCDFLQTYQTRADASASLSLFTAGDRAALEAVWQRQHDEITALAPSDGIRYFVFYVLDHMELIEHGGSVGGAWLSEKGKAVLKALKAEADDEFETLCVNCCMHGFSIASDTEDEQCPECDKLNR